MKKHVLLFLSIVAFTITASAQKKIVGGKFNLAAEGAIPVGSASDAYSFGIGISGKFEAPLADKVNFTANLGYTSFMIKDDVKKLLAAFGDNSSARGFVPVEAGLKYHFTPIFYGEGQIGAAIGTKSGVGTAFAYTPGIGLIVPASNGNAVDVGFRYEGWVKDGDTLGFIGLRLAYKFSL
jgi:hypothetical protein